MLEYPFQLNGYKQIDRIPIPIKPHQKSPEYIRAFLLWLNSDENPINLFLTI